MFPCLSETRIGYTPSDSIRLHCPPCRFHPTRRQGQDRWALQVRIAGNGWVASKRQATLLPSSPPIPTEKADGGDAEKRESGRFRNRFRRVGHNDFAVGTLTSRNGNRTCIVSAAAATAAR